MGNNTTKNHIKSQTRSNLIAKRITKIHGDYILKLFI